jgi:phospholipid transport system substrate-binding protein
LAIALLPTVTLAETPNEVVQEAAQLLDEKLSAKKDELAADREALYALIDEILLPRFDQKYAAQLVLGRHWRAASAEQRESFIDAFYSHLLRQYADGVLEFDLGMIEILPFRGDLSDPRTLVRTVVTLDDGTEVPVDYGMVNRDKGWQMFDVTIEGISYVRNFRSELNSEIQSSSLDAVIERLQKESGSKAGAE